ncbi:MAG: hypothetical protein ACJ746_08755 [Bryobacteraceae bacterium]
MVLRSSLLFCVMILSAAIGWHRVAAGSEPKRNFDIAVSRVPNGGIQPRLLADGRGVVHLLYYSGDPAHGDLYYVTSSDEGRSWTKPLRVNGVQGSAVALGTIRGGQIAAGRNGRIYVAWNGSSLTEGQGPMNPESRKRGMPLLYTRLNDTHTGFEPERNLMTHTFGLDGGGTITADNASDVYIAWHGKAPGAAAGEAGRQVWVTKSTDDGKSFSSEQPATKDATGACGCCGMAFYSDSKGALYGLYRSATENVHRDIFLLSSTDHGMHFSDRRLDAWNINACPMSSMDFAEEDGNVEAAWETGGQVYFQNVSNSSARPISAPGPNKGHKHPRLSIAPNGETLLAWTEGTGWGRGGSIAWQTYDASGNSMQQSGVETGLPAWSFGAVVAVRSRFLLLY